MAIYAVDSSRSIISPTACRRSNGCRRDSASERETLTSPATGRSRNEQEAVQFSHGVRLRRSGGGAVRLRRLAVAQAAGAVSLKSAAAAKGRYFGAALDPAFLADPVYRDLATREFSSITPENAMKWPTVEPAQGLVDWTAADAVAAFAKANGQKLRGHNLIWPDHLPAWVDNGRFSPAALRDLIESHVASEVARYNGAAYAWDVVNEPFDDAGHWRGGVLYDALGADYVAIALRAARAADPQAKLYVNEYNVEHAGAKFDALYQLVASLKRSGAPIDGVGLQAISSPAARPPICRRRWRGSRRSTSTSRSPNSIRASNFPRAPPRSPARPTSTAPSSPPVCRSPAASASPPGASPTPIPGYPRSFPATAPACCSTNAANRSRPMRG